LFYTFFFFPSSIILPFSFQIRPPSPKLYTHTQCIVYIVTWIKDGQQHVRIYIRYMLIDCDPLFLCIQTQLVLHPTSTIIYIDVR
jgi:hypothetical protein